MNKSESIIKLAGALVKFNSEISKVSKDASNPFFKNKYATLDNVIDAARPILTQNGLSILQLPAGDGEHAIMKTLLLHESGEWIESEALIIKPIKNDPQAYGSCITYMRRYSLTSFLSLNTGEDDDGNIATGNKHGKGTTTEDLKDLDNIVHTITKDEAKKLLEVANKANVTAATVTKQLLAKFKLSLPSQLNKEQYDIMIEGYENMKKGVK